MDNSGDRVNEGDYVIIQRQDYMKLHKMTKKGVTSLGKDQIDLCDIVGKPFWCTYKMEPVLKAKRSYVLKLCDGATNSSDAIIKEVTSGIDNRGIVDDGRSQKLSTEEIINLKESGLSGHKIIGQLVENSKTFHHKTEYSQEKYLKKKEKKYFEYVTIRKPTLRLVAEIILRQGPSSTLGLRMDTLAQIASISSVQSGGTYLLYESGCQGLVAAHLLSRLGNAGVLINTHPLLTPQKQAVLALNLKTELDCLLTVNIQTLYKRLTGSEQVTHEENNKVLLDDDSVSLKNNQDELPSNKRKADDIQQPSDIKRPRWEIETEKAAEILKTKKADGLIIVCREHPVNIFKFLIKYIGLSRPFLIYSPVREPLQELYSELKFRRDIIAIRLTESWLRQYQVLPDRTHPDINVSGSGGYLLSGILVDSS